MCLSVMELRSQVEVSARCLFLVLACKLISSSPIYDAHSRALWNLHNCYNNYNVLCIIYTIMRVLAASVHLFDVYL